VNETAASTKTGPRLYAQTPAGVVPCWVLVFLCLLIFKAPVASGAERFVPGRVLVKPRAAAGEAKLAGALRAHRGHETARLHKQNIRVVQFDESQAEQVVAMLRQDPDIEFAERDGLAEAVMLPNDPILLSGEEWHISRVGASEAWNVTVGRPDVIVAVLDSGITAGHPDLAGHLLPGFDFVGNDNNPADDFGHGTAVAGVIAASGNNGSGVAGIAFGCSLLPVKVVDSSGFAAYSTVAQGIRFAVDQGARIINLSVAGSASSITMQEAINYAWERNVIVVAAAGNNGTAELQYPAACEHVLAVSATEPDDSRAAFSAYGNHIGLSAPGENIWTTQRDLGNPYGVWRGTSFSSPLVAGAAALVASANVSLSNTQIVSLLEESADDLGTPGFDPLFGFGRVNAFRAVSMAVPESRGLDSSSTSGPAITLTSPGQGADFILGAKVVLSAMAQAQSGNITLVEFFANDSKVAACSLPPFATTWVPPRTGPYVIHAVATDGSGNSTPSASITLEVASESVAPVLKLTRAPANGARVFSPWLMLAGVASDNAGLEQIQVRLNGGDYQLVDGLTNWNAQLFLAPGTNRVALRARDAAGNASAEIVRSWFYSVPSALTLQTNGFGTISPRLNGAMLEIGRSYAIRAIPAPGQVFAGWEGLNSDSPLLRFVMQSNLVLVAKFVPSPFVPVKGTYSGLAANTNGVSPQDSGSFSITVTTSGIFSGKLLLAGQRYGFRGQFNLVGDATVSVPRPLASPLELRLKLDLTNGTGQVQGSLTDGAWVAQLSGDRNIFNSRLNPAQQAGVRQFLLENSEPIPATAATGVGKISTAGGTSVKGRLIDGRPFATAGTLSPTGDYPFYLSLNRGTEVVIGWLNFPAAQIPTAAGTVLWVKSGTNSFAATLQATSAGL
jgi:thermitase